MPFGQTVSIIFSDKEEKFGFGMSATKYLDRVDRVRNSAALDLKGIYRETVFIRYRRLEHGQTVTGWSGMILNLERRFSCRDKNQPIQFELLQRLPG